jgi:dipeptidase D
MQEKIVENFIKITKLAHCSKKADSLLTFLMDFAQKKGYETQTDEAKNLWIYKGNSKLAVQAHYDMVCMGKAPEIETYIEEGWMYAVDSSLGADNGMAIAMMMLLMEEGKNLEFVLTADEEIGLVGAGEIDFELSSDYMLNVDFEDEGLVCIGCAGGADLLAQQSFDVDENDYPYSYEIRVEGLSGGHSGVEIHKNIPNAIKVLAEYLEGKKLSIASCQGGERRNSIPTSIQMKLSSKEPLCTTKWVKVKALDEVLTLYKTDALLNFLSEFKQGVESYNEEFNLPDTSINLALVNFIEGKATIECSSRAMSEEGLEEINQKTIQLFEKYRFFYQIEDKYASWKPEVNAFTTLVNNAMTTIYGESRYEAIHAGLECGVLLERYPHIKFASIGPTIESPHSTHERVKLDSVGKTYKVIEELISTL